MPLCTALPGPSFTRTLKSLLLTVLLTRSLNPGGSQTPEFSEGQPWENRVPEIHSPQVSPQLMEYTVIRLIRVDYPQFQPWQCLTEMQRKFCGEWKVRNVPFRKSMYISRYFLTMTNNTSFIWAGLLEQRPYSLPTVLLSTNFMTSEECSQ